MQVNVSYLKFDKKLKDNMYATALPLYKNVNVDWKDMHRVVSSDYIQYSPYYFENRIKKGINWNNDKQNLLIFDIDSDLTIEEAKHIFKKFKYLITTTKTHQKEKKGLKCDRYRVILPATNIPKGDVYFEMLSIMVEQLPAIDKQPNCKSGAFLGNSKAINSYNDGEIYDCTKGAELAEYRLNNKMKLKKKQSEIRVSSNVNRNIDMDKFRKKLDFQVVCDVIDSLGYEVIGSKFRLRDERTESCSIFPDGYIKDFGGDFNGDVIKLMMEYHNMTFIESFNYINNFLEGE